VDALLHLWLFGVFLKCGGDTVDVGGRVEANSRYPLRRLYVCVHLIDIVLFAFRGV